MIFNNDVGEEYFMILLTESVSWPGQEHIALMAVLTAGTFLVLILQMKKTSLREVLRLVLSAESSFPFW